jgi:DNA-binding MarR family transcriptional regulator
MRIFERGQLTRYIFCVLINGLVVYLKYRMLTQEDQILAALRRIMRAVDLHSRHLLDAHGMTGPQLAVLQAAERLQQGSATALARTVHLSGATVSGILDRLERGGLVRRERDDCDRRSVAIVVTDAGRSMLEKAPSLLQDQFRIKLESLEDWERTQVLATLERIASMMSVSDLDASPILVAGPVAPPPLDPLPISQMPSGRASEPATNDGDSTQSLSMKGTS